MMVQGTSMESFVRQLNYYGFTKVSWAMERSPSLPEFLAEEVVFASSRKVSTSIVPYVNWHSQYIHKVS